NLKIPKPTREPGRPGSGGFCVEDSLVKTHGWSEDSQETIQVEARKELNTTISYCGHSKHTIQKICTKLYHHWPELKNYEGCWPVHSILKLALKYSTEASRCTSANDANWWMCAALRGSSPEEGL
ncbi:hypothetical protein L208DRAFT_1320870, partial [Tricholoma matsutake]